MPANLPPEYHEAELNYKKASTLQEKVAALELLISTIPKHKGTDKLRADLRRRLSKLREESVRKKGGGKGDLYSVEKQGAAQVALAGLPNSGKSSLLAALTNAHPVIADYPMSTVVPLSGMMPFEDIQFQIVDLPPVGNAATDGWVSAILRNADMVLAVIDLSDAPEVQAGLLLEQLENWKLPLVTAKSAEDEKRDKRYKPLVMAANKSELSGTDGEIERLRRRYGADYAIVAVSSRQRTGMEKLGTVIFQGSRIIRVYTKEPGRAPDLETPFVLSSGSDVLMLAGVIHKDFVINFKYACIWGSAKFEGQRVHKDYILHDRDIVEFYVK